VSWLAIAGALVVGGFFVGSVVQSGELRGLGPVCAWYWRRGLWGLLTVPLFAYLVGGIAIELRNWVLLSFAVGMSATSLIGGIAGFVALSIAIPLLMLSPALWFSLLKATPGLWSDRGPTKWKVVSWCAVFVGFQIAAYGLNYGAFRLAAWMADRAQGFR